MSFLWHTFMPMGLLRCNGRIELPRSRMTMFVCSFILAAGQRWTGPYSACICSFVREGWEAPSRSVNLVRASGREYVVNQMKHACTFSNIYKLYSGLCDGSDCVLVTTLQVNFEYHTAF